jgi:hypothetical protein
VSDLHANENEASTGVPRLRLSKSGTPKASKRRKSRSGAQSKSPLQCDQDIEPQQKLFIEMAKMLADIQKASSDRKASFGVDETLKPPLAQHLGSGSVAVKRSSSLPEQGVPGGPLLSRDMLLGLVDGDQERLALLIRSRGGFAFWSKEGGLFGFGQHDLTMAANYLIYLGHLGAQVDGPQLLSPELASHPDFPEDGDLSALCSFLQQSGIVIPSTLAEADVSDIAGFKALRVFAKTRAAKANEQALKFTENLQGHRAALETGLARAVPSQRSFSDPTANCVGAYTHVCFRGGGELLWAVGLGRGQHLASDGHVPFF